MATYAADTKVSVDRSRAEIERTLARYGADAFSYGYSHGRASIAFAIDGRHVRFDLTVPARDAFRRTPTGMARADETIDREWERAQRQQWRALALFVKATLEAVESGLLTVEQAFLAHIMLPDGSTTHDWMAPQLQEVYATGDMPELLPPARRGLLEVHHG